jgi:xanthine dehydrogenase accessory factor
MPYISIGIGETLSDIDEIIAAARDWAGQPMALATVIEASGSAPRLRGGHLLVAADGRFAGSISGGCVEYEVFALAEGVIAGKPASLTYYGSSDSGAWLPGLPCGGQIGVLVQPVSESGFSPALFEELAMSRSAGIALPLSTDLGTGLTVKGEHQGQFVNVYEPARRLLIVGAVQIAQALSAIARTIGFAVTINDPRERFLNAERFPDALLTDAWPDEAVAAFAPNAQSAVVTLSHDIKIDDPALAAALAAPTGYIGALGSRANHTRRIERLAALGFGAEDLARIDGPAGIHIGGLGPQEIALSIAAGMVSALRGIR